MRLESKFQFIGCESELPDSLFSKFFKSYEAGMLEEAARLAQLLEGNGNETFPYSAKIIEGDQRNLTMALRALAELKQSKGLVIGTGN